MAPFSTEKHEITDLQTGNSEGWLEQEYQEITFFIVSLPLSSYSNF